MPTIAVIGSQGYVGKACVEFFRHHYGVVEHEKGSTNYAEVNGCDLAVVAVPTPMRADGSCDTSIVEEVLGWLTAPLILLRSTVPPGTTARLRAATGKRIVFQPEYIGEGRYWQPYKFNTVEVEAPFYILGGPPEDTQPILDLIVPIAGPTKTYRTMGATDAELVKYMENAYFATKVTFANEMRRICEAHGGNYWTVRDGWALDPRVDPMHTAVFATAPGFGGKCLPKDTNAIVASSREHGYEAAFLQEVLDSNARFRGEVPE